MEGEGEKQQGMNQECFSNKFLLHSVLLLASHSTHLSYLYKVKQSMNCVSREGCEETRMCWADNKVHNGYEILHCEMNLAKCDVL